MNSGHPVDDRQRALWMALDECQDAEQRSQCLGILADHYDDLGDSRAAEYLRLRLSGSQGGSGYLDNVRLRALLNELDKRSLRLFACDCVDQVDAAVDDELTAATLRIVRRHAFGLVSDQTLHRAQELTYERWEGAANGVDYEAGLSKRARLWALTRATGLVSRRRRTSNPVADAFYTANGAAAGHLVAVPNVKQRREDQIVLAREYVLLGRSYDACADIIEINRELLKR